MRGEGVRWAAVPKPHPAGTGVSSFRVGLLLFCWQSTPDASEGGNPRRGRGQSLASSGGFSLVLLLLNDS